MLFSRSARASWRASTTKSRSLSELALAIGTMSISLPLFAFLLYLFLGYNPTTFRDEPILFSCCHSVYFKPSHRARGVHCAHRFPVTTHPSVPRICEAGRMAFMAHLNRKETPDFPRSDQWRGKSGIMLAAAVESHSMSIASPKEKKR